MTPVPKYLEANHGISNYLISCSTLLSSKRAIVNELQHFLIPLQELYCEPFFRVPTKNDNASTTHPPRFINLRGYDQIPRTGQHSHRGRRICRIEKLQVPRKGLQPWSRTKESCSCRWTARYENDDTTVFINYRQLGIDETSPGIFLQLLIKVSSEGRASLMMTPLFRFAVLGQADKLVRIGLSRQCLSLDREEIDGRRSQGL